jgi:hypothetical protein
MPAMHRIARPSLCCIARNAPHAHSERGSGADSTLVGATTTRRLAPARLFVCLFVCNPSARCSPHGVACAATGVLAATLAPILWYFLLTLRLRNAFFVAVFDFFIYNFVLLLGSGMTVRTGATSAPGLAPRPRRDSPHICAGLGHRQERHLRAEHGGRRVLRRVPEGAR